MTAICLLVLVSPFFLGRHATSGILAPMAILPQGMLPPGWGATASFNALMVTAVSLVWLVSAIVGIVAHGLFEAVSGRFRRRTAAA